MSPLEDCRRKRVHLTQALKRLGLHADGLCWCAAGAGQEHSAGCDFARVALEVAGIDDARGSD